MKILVTGSTGFIGANLCRALLEAGHAVHAFHRPTSSLRLLEGLAVEHVLGDLTQPETIQDAMSGMDAVFHAAAWMGDTEPGKLYSITVEGTREVVQAARKAGVQRFVHTSSVAALGVPTLGLPSLLNETHTWNFRPDHYPYGYAKYLAELEVQKAVAQGLNAVIVNPTLVFGPGDLYRQSKSVVNQVAARKLTLAVEGGINAVDIADVVSGELAAFERGKTGERYILGGQNFTLLELVQTIARITSVPIPGTVLPARLVRALSGPVGMLHNFLDLPVPVDMFHLAGYYFYYDTRKAQVDLSLPPPRPAADAIRAAYHWFTGTPIPQPEE